MRTIQQATSSRHHSLHPNFSLAVTPPRVKNKTRKGLPPHAAYTGTCRYTKIILSPSLSLSNKIQQRLQLTLSPVRNAHFSQPANMSSDSSPPPRPSAAPHPKPLYLPWEHREEEYGDAEQWEQFKRDIDCKFTRKYALPALTPRANVDTLTTSLA